MNLSSPPSNLPHSLLIHQENKIFSAFFATVLNTLLGVLSIDKNYFLAARCLGSRPIDVFRNVVVPGALPFIFTGLQISMGIAWLSLVAGEIIAGQKGLGYAIYEGYSLFQFGYVCGHEE